MTDPRLLLLAPDDNVYVLRAGIAEGETIAIEDMPVTMTKTIPRGHKLARCDIEANMKILKYGAPIGSATQPIARGDHVHVHNIKSDYTATYTIDKTA